MSETAIRIENLGKKYLINHQSKPQHTTVRDAATEGARRHFRFEGRSRLKVEEFWALREVSLEVKRGAVLGVIGQNGAGKSTFLKLLSRITQPTTGKIEYVGTVASLLEVGAGFHPELSGRENIFLNGAILGMRRSEIQNKFDEIVEFAAVERFLDTPVKHYSSGMYMRLAFAVAAHLEPDILLVDEVLAVGDAEFQRKCLGKMQQVSREGDRTVVFVSHNMQAVKALCTQTARFQDGRLIDSGATEDVVRRYLAATVSKASVWSCGESTIPESNDLTLLSVEVTDEQGSTGVYTSSSELTITMKIHISSIMPGLCVGFDLLTQDGTTVLRSYQTDQAEPRWPRQIPGLQSWSCIVPAGLLNGGIYYLSPRIGIHNIRWLVTLDAVLQIEVILDHGVSPTWNSLSGGSRPGVVAPILNWSMANGASNWAGREGTLNRGMRC